jgi:hypothetical protein
LVQKELFVSADFRPVREIWGEPCGSFLEHDGLLSFLEVIADCVKALCQSDSYGDKDVFWVSNGEAFVNYVESNPEFTPEFMMAELEDQGQSPDVSSVASQVENAKAQASEWRKSFDKDGSLRFYVD